MKENKVIEWLRAISATQSNSLNKNSLIDRKEALHMAIVAVEELEQYRAIGTVEESREAMKKQRAKISNWSDDLISRGMIIDLLDREIKTAKEMGNQCEECYKNGFVLRQAIYSSLKDCVMALPSFNDTLNFILKQFENLKESAENETNYHFDRCSNYPCEYNAADLSEKSYKTLCDVIEIVKSGGVADE